MKAFASLHTAKPAHSADAEVSYAGYKRVEIDWTPKFGRQAAQIVFAEVTESSDLKGAFVAISAEESGPGGLLQLVSIQPNIPLLKDYTPRVIFANIAEPLPEKLHPIAAAAWHAVNDRVLDPADLPPKVFEALNTEFELHGLKIMTVTREGAAKIEVNVKQVKRLDFQT